MATFWHNNASKPIGGLAGAPAGIMCIAYHNANRHVWGHCYWWQYIKHIQMHTLRQPSNRQQYTLL